MGININGIIDRGLSTVLSPADKNFIGNMNSIIHGDFSIKNMSSALQYLTSGGGVKDFEGDWLLDYFQSRVGKADLSPIGNILGLDASMLAQFDQAVSFAQTSLDVLSNIGYGVGDFVTSVTSSVTGFFNDVSGSVGSVVRSIEPIKNLFTYVGVLDQPGDPLQHNINQLLEELAETNGYIISRKRSKYLATEFHFITRPFLESDTMGRYRSYVFFTRPNMNLVVKNTNGQLIPHPQLYKYKELSALVESDLELYSELCRDNCSKSNLFTLLNNYCKEIPNSKINETDREGIKNKFGFSMPVTGVTNNTGIDISVTFLDNASGDISKLFYCWDLYQREVSKGGLAKRPEYIRYNMIDTAVSAYIFVVDTNFNIISMGTAIGLHKSDTPTHFNKHSLDGMTKEEVLGDFTVSFKCFEYTPHNPSYYDAFNRISGFDPSRIVDTSGSSRVLYKMPVKIEDKINTIIDKSITDGIVSHRCSVFDKNYHGFKSNIDFSTGILEESKSTFLNKAASLGDMVIDTVSDFGRSIGFFKDNSKTSSAIKPQRSINFGYYMPYPDVFEFASRMPGVYAFLADDVEPTSYLPMNNRSKTTEPRKIKFRLGFSR